MGCLPCRFLVGLLLISCMAACLSAINCRAALLHHLSNTLAQRHRITRLGTIWHVAACTSTACTSTACTSTACTSTACTSMKQHATARHSTAQLSTAQCSAATATNLSEALDSCIYLLLWDADGAVKVAAGPNGAILCFVVHCADGGALQPAQTRLVQQLLCHLHE